jgi:L-ascorbate metabolism protein UlaG (beta-lactamase superfamily)
MKYQLKNKKAKWVKIDKSPSQRLHFPSVADHSIHYKQVNHATVLIQHKGQNILTDPVYSKRASPILWAGPSRYRPPSIPFDSLPKIDVIVLSHDHYDHLDVETLKKLSNRDAPKIFVGLGTKAFLEKFDIKNVIEMDWFDDYINKEIKITFLPAKHWSNRLFSPRKTLWGSWMFSSTEKNIYFAGDTGYDDHFKRIKQDFPNIHLALIPIGAYKPRSFMQHVHMAPEDAFLAHKELAPETSFAIHWGTFQLTHEGMFSPIDELQEILDKENDNSFHYDRNHDQFYKIQ